MSKFMDEFEDGEFSSIRVRGEVLPLTFRGWLFFMIVRAAGFLFVVWLLIVLLWFGWGGE